MAVRMRRRLTDTHIGSPGRLPTPSESAVMLEHSFKDAREIRVPRRVHTVHAFYARFSRFIATKQRSAVGRRRRLIESNAGRDENGKTRDVPFENSSVKL